MELLRVKNEGTGRFVERSSECNGEGKIECENCEGSGMLKKAIDDDER